MLYRFILLQILMLGKYIYTPDLFPLAPRRREQEVNPPKLFPLIPNPVILMPRRVKFRGQKLSAFYDLHSREYYCAQEITGDSY